ncbi:MAG: ShlB/FhaC/HecB family hemolysin secretion/activation protein [Gemmatimonadaceae bacterium]
MLLTFALGLALQVQPQAQPPLRGDSLAPRLVRILDSIASVRADEVAARAQRRAEIASRRRVEPRRAVTPEHLATAFKDAASRTLFYRARAARMTQDSALISYDVNAYQRISAGIGFNRLGRDRLIFRNEQAGRIRWHRDVGIWMDITGSRTVLPGIPDIGESEAKRALAEESDEMLPVPYFPGYEPLWGGPEGARPDILEAGPIHPLAEGSEAYYTYRLGDSVAITLPDHRTFQLRAIEVRPRETRWDALVGTLWFDLASGQLVRAAYRFAVPMHIDAFVKKQNPDAFEDVPVWVKPLIFPMHGEISAITIEYGIYEGRFWLPRQRTAEGTGKASFMRVPFRMEQVFRYNSVNGLASLPPIPLPQVMRFGMRPHDSLGVEARRAWRDSIVAASLARRDSIRMGLRRFRQCDTSDVRVSADRRYGDARVSVAVRTPCDLSKLETSADLPASIYDPGDELFDLKARDALIAEALTMGAQPPLTLNPLELPRPEWTHGLRLVRYNRIEGLSAGVDATQSIGGGWALAGLARIGIADLYPNGEVSLARSNIASAAFIAGYRRLVPAGDWGNPLSFGSSLSAVLFGRDEGFYYRAVGVELGGRTERGTPFEWRYFAERQTPARPETDFSLAGDLAMPNIGARAGWIGGTALRVKPAYGSNPNGFRVFSDLRLEAATTGDSTYARGALDLTLTGAAGKLVGALTLSGGSSMGLLPSQRRWYLGGTHSIRGESPDTVQSGNAYWMTRGELSRTVYGMRPVLFADFGWVGDRTRLSDVGRPLSGAGTGISLLDGLIRFDVARGIHPRRQWRVDLYVDALF